jgi:type I restriction enzyme, S subunit
MSNAVKQLPLSNFMAERLGAIDPANFPDETFELYSIPAYDSRCPDVTDGDAIGSTKQMVKPGDVLLSKIVPHIRRSWVVGPVNEHRQIASGEWIVFRGDTIEPRYLGHIFLTDRFHKQFMATVAGVGGSLLRA